MNNNIKKFGILAGVTLCIYILIQLVGSFYTYLSNLLESNTTLAVLFVITIISILYYGLHKLAPSVLLSLKSKFFKDVKKPHEYNTKNCEVEKALNEYDNGINPAVVDKNKIPVVGSSNVGKSLIVKYLRESSKSKQNDENVSLEFCELPSLGTDIKRNIYNLKNYTCESLMVFVVTQDLTNYEFEALRYAGEHFSNVLVVINKVDTLSTNALSEIDIVIKQRVSKLQGHFVGPLHLKADPKPITRIVVDAKGVETESQFTPEPDFGNLLKHINLLYPQQRDKEGKA